MNNKAVPNGPFLLSQANAEFGGNQWASNILAKANLPAPRLLSTLMGKSAASNILTVGNYSNQFGYRDVSGAPVFGAVSGGNVLGKVVTELVARTDNVAWISVYGVVAGTVRATLPNGVYVDFNFRNDSEGNTSGGDVAGWCQYITARNGQQIPINITRI